MKSNAEIFPAVVSHTEVSTISRNPLEVEKTTSSLLLSSNNPIMQQPLNNYSDDKELDDQYADADFEQDEIQNHQDNNFKRS